MEEGSTRKIRKSVSLVIANEQSFVFLITGVICFIVITIDVIFFILAWEKDRAIQASSACYSHFEWMIVICAASFWTFIALSPYIIEMYIIRKESLWLNIGYTISWLLTFILFEIMNNSNCHDLLLSHIEEYLIYNEYVQNVLSFFTICVSMWKGYSDSRRMNRYQAMQRQQQIERSYDSSHPPYHGDMDMEGCGGDSPSTSNPMLQEMKYSTSNITFYCNDDNNFRSPSNHSEGRRHRDCENVNEDDHESGMTPF